jgi:flagellar basal-body rod protein FlgF
LNRGLYAAASGMVAQKTALDAIANNLANVATTGFKRDSVVFSTFGGVLAEVQGSQVAGILADTSEGPLQNTGRPLDLAIDGEGYFCIQTPDGVRYTRNGAFEVGTNGDLVTKAGQLVLGQKGAIDLGNASQVEVTGDGRVLGDGAEVGRLRLAELPPESLTRVGDSQFDSAEAPQEVEPEIRSGALEKSNVSVVSEMVAMIAATRHYEACAKALSVQDEILGQAANRLGQA